MFRRGGGGLPLCEQQRADEQHCRHADLKNVHCLISHFIRLLHQLCVLSECPAFSKRHSSNKPATCAIINADKTVTAVSCTSFISVTSNGSCSRIIMITLSLQAANNSIMDRNTPHNNNFFHLPSPVWARCIKYSVTSDSSALLPIINRFLFGATATVTQRATQTAEIIPKRIPYGRRSSCGSLLKGNDKTASTTANAMIGIPHMLIALTESSLHPSALSAAPFDARAARAEYRRPRPCRSSCCTCARRVSAQQPSASCPVR